MVSYELLAIVFTGLALAVSIIYYSYTIRNQSLAIKTQNRLEKRKVQLDLLNRQITFYSELDGRLNEDNASEVSDPINFINEKFTQADVKTKYSDLAIGTSAIQISNFYNARPSNANGDWLLSDLLESIYNDLEALKKKRNALLNT
jgi:hypothetical protein